jgi:TRAP-type C4-dicarboxylate transport system, periplasmic component
MIANQGETAMRIGLLCAAVSLCALVGTPAAAQVQERTIRWGHLNNTDHPSALACRNSPRCWPPRAAAS